MTDFLLTVWQSPIARTAFAGAVSAFLIDLHVWHSWGDVAFNIKTASFRWLTGAITSGAVAAGFQVMA